jgi:hypothetical protein
MAHFAKVLNNVVLEVIKAEQEYINSLGDTSPVRYIQTSFNSHGNVHYITNTITPSGNAALRANYAGDHFIYNDEFDVFHAPRPRDKNGLLCESFTLNTSTWLWEAPIPCPDGAYYQWSEELQAWL